MSKAQIKKDPIPELYYKIGEILKRLKILEERTHSLAEKLQNLNDQIVELKKSFVKYKSENNEELDKLKKQLTEINTKIKAFEREMPRLVKKNEIEVLKKVFSLWDPMNFVTEKELEFILNDKFEEFKKELVKELVNNINNFPNKVSNNFTDKSNNIRIEFKDNNRDRIQKNLDNNFNNNVKNVIVKRPLVGLDEKFENNKITIKSPTHSKFLKTNKDENLENKNKLEKNYYNEISEPLSFLSKPSSNKTSNKKNLVNQNEKETRQNLTNLGENNKEDKNKGDIKIDFKHIKIPSFIKNKKIIKINEKKEEIGENLNRVENSKGMNSVEDKRKNTTIKLNNNILPYIDIKEEKKKKLMKLEEKFKEKLKKSYDEFSKDWMEL